jgi:hypothetical protein
MFEKLMKELEKLEQGIRVPVEVSVDDEGYLDRVCHSETCRAEFKVLAQDWREKTSNERVYCPVCRFEAPSTEWNTDEQREYLKSVAIAHLQDVVHSALIEDVHRFNHARRPGFVQISLSAKRGARPTIVPIEAAKMMRQLFVCEACGCHYASVGAAFFCPACGHNSAVATFGQTTKVVCQFVALAPSIRGALAKEFDDDLAQDSVRNMLRRKNVFQNLSESSDLWRDAVGKGYEDMLLPSELQELEALFQQRHLMAHRNGIVDQEYIDRSGDSTYSVGQRLVVREAAVLRLAALLSNLAGELRKVI